MHAKQFDNSTISMALYVFFFLCLASHAIFSLACHADSHAIIGSLEKHKERLGGFFEEPGYFYYKVVYGLRQNFLLLHGKFRIAPLIMTTSLCFVPLCHWRFTLEFFSVLAQLDNTEHYLKPHYLI